MRTTNRSNINGPGSRWRRPGPALGWIPLAVALLLAGCTSAPYTPIDSSMTGDYKLVSVDGKAVPCHLNHQGHDMEIKSGLFVIQADGTCTSKIAIANPSGPESTIDRKATYKHRSGTLTMKWEGAGTTVGTLAGDTFTMNNEGIVFAYRK